MGGSLNAVSEDQNGAKLLHMVRSFFNGLVNKGHSSMSVLIACASP